MECSIDVRVAILVFRGIGNEIKGTRKWVDFQFLLFLTLLQFATLNNEILLPINNYFKKYMLKYIFSTIRLFLNNFFLL